MYAQREEHGIVLPKFDARDVPVVGQFELFIFEKELTLENRWRIGQAARDPGRPVVEPGISVDDLRFLLKPAGFKKGELPAYLAPDNEILAEKAVTDGFKELTDPTAAADAGRVDFQRIEAAAKSPFTFAIPKIWCPAQRLSISLISKQTWLIFNQFQNFASFYASARAA